MAIRAFLTTWSTIKRGGLIYVINSLSEYVDTLPPPSIECVQYYADRDADGMPDKSYVLVLARSTPESLARLDGLANVVQLPARRADKRIDEIPAQQKTAFIAATRARGIPDDVVIGAATVGDVIARIARHLSANNKRADAYYSANSADLA